MFKNPQSIDNNTAAGKWEKEIRERFRMTDDRYALELSLNRGSYRASASGDLILTCALYATFGPSGKDDHAPRIRTSMFLTSSDIDSEHMRLVMTHTGVTLNFGHNDIDNIHSVERDRLHALLKELRGVIYKYTPDLFGFLRKDGSDVPQVYSLAFPSGIEEDKGNGDPAHLSQQSKP